jgi:cytoskeletal protein CcmA (bactofilin family)
MDQSGDNSSDDAPAPQYARGSRKLPPAKAFVSKPFAAGSGKSVPVKGPLVKWPSGKPGDSLKPASSSSGAAKPTEENMSERFIAERLLSDRGSNTFNPQVQRRVPDIPNLSSVKATEADADGKRLVIGRAVTVSGAVGGCERMVVEGKVDVTLKDVKTLEVGAQGQFKGTAHVETAVIAGTFEGTLKVSGHLDVGAGAVVKGAVSYGTIAVAAGGKLLGTIEAQDAGAP